MTPPGRRSTRIAAVAATQAIAVASGSKKATEDKPVVNEALKFLKDCIIYVDVKTEGGEEAGSLFVQMLESVGARVRSVYSPFSKSVVDQFLESGSSKSGSKLHPYRLQERNAEHNQSI